MNELLLRRRLMLAAKGDTPIDYLKFIALTDNSVLGLANRSSYQTVLEYSFDEETWVDFNTGTTVALANSGDTVYVRGKLTGNNFLDRFTQFETINGEFSISGNINTIWNYKNLDQPLYRYCGYGLFKGCTGLIDANELSLPTIILSDACYHSMFAGCTSLTTAPELPATTLADDCYISMFDGCTSLIEAPELPATELANGCYASMFRGCTSLTKAPELPATTLASNCYRSMFLGCTSLTKAPELPATALTSACYYYMFSGCTILTIAPELPATTLASFCYWGMFQSCSSLNYIKCLAVNGVNQNNSTGNWVLGVASSGTFVKHPDVSESTWGSGSNGIPDGWTVQ